MKTNTRTCLAGLFTCICLFTVAATTFAQSPPPASFVAARTFAAGSGTASVAVGDFNGDGKQDLAVPNYSKWYVSVLLGNGDGTFKAAGNYGVAGYPVSVTVGDFNGDGHLDLAVACHGYSYSNIPDNVTVLLNKGDGTFQSAVYYAVGASPSSVTVGDFNHDGYPDLAVANGGTTTVSVLFNNGDGTFQAAVNYGVHWSPSSVTVGDFNGDGKLDLAVANQGSGDVSVLINNGDGTFQGAVNYGADTGPRSVTVGDFNGDGYLDLAVANQTNNDVSVLLGNGDGTFQGAVNYAVGNSPQSVTVRDFNGDGYLDLATANNGSGDVSVLLGKGDGTFQGAVNYAAGSGLQAVTVGDFNGDGTADLAVASSYGYVSVLLGNGNGTFQAAPEYTTGHTPTSVALGDFNGDGKLDLAVANRYSPNVSVLLGNGDGTFQAPVNYTVGGGPTSVAVGDFNGDGKLDLAVANSGYGYNQVSVLLGNGDGTFQAAVGYAAGTTPWSVAVGDFNGDGYLDLAVANYDSYNVSVLLNNGDGTFAAAVNYGAGGYYPQSVTVGDFNGDGKPDLAVANSYMSTVSVRLNNGDGTFKGEVRYSLGAAGGYSVAVGDFNGDGKLDLALACYNSYASWVSVLLGNGDGSFQLYVSYNAGFDPLSATVGDFNGDGKPDLAVGNTDGTVSVLLGKGDGTFQAPVNFAAGYNAASVTVGDFNGDGKPDLAVANNAYSGSVSVFLNTTKPATSTSLISDVNPSAFGQAVTFTATVSALGGTPTGTVTFMDGATSLGTEPLSSGTATLTTSALAAGSHSITAVYGGDSTFGVSTSAVLVQTVQGPPAVSLDRSSINFGNRNLGTTSSGVGITVTNTGAGALSVSSVSLGGTNPGDFALSADTCTGTSVGSNGTCTVAVTFTPTALGARSATLSIYDNAPGSPQTVALSGTGTLASTTTTISAPTATYNANASVTVTVTSSAGTVTGSVSLTVDGGTPTSQALSGGSAVFNVASPSAGDHTLSASYAAQGNFDASSSSGTLHVNKASPTITWSNPADIVYGTALSSTQLNAAASFNGSPIPGTLTYTPAAGTVLSAGNGQTLSVSFAPTDTTNFNSASASVQINVSKAPLSITANNAARQYGQANPTFTATYSGFVNGENPSVLTGTLACSSPATPSSPVSGTPYTITCSGQSSNNYAITYVAGQLTVNKAHLTVTADAQTRAYGAANPTFTATLSGFQNGETLGTSGATGAASFSGTATTTTGTSAPGPYPITPAQGTLAATNYDFTPFVDGTLTINKAILTVTADLLSRAYGAADPTLTVSYSGLASGEDQSVLGGTLACTSSATPSSAVSGSPYTITCSGQSSTNYGISYAAGELTVTKATPAFSNLTASQTIVFGTASATLSGKIAAGTVTPPAGETMTITINGASQSASTGSAGAFTASFDTHAIPAAASPYVITYSYAGDSDFSSAVEASTTVTVIAPAVSLSATSLSFGNQLVGTTGALQTVTLSNTGSAALTISSIATTGDFAETNTCGSSVAAGGSCTITVTFTPSAAGTLNGQLAITDNAPNSPQLVSLAGTGTTVPVVGFSSPSVTFGSQVGGSTSADQSVTITNNGSTPLSFTGFPVTGEFAIDAAGTTCSTSTPLAAGQTCVIAVNFTPTAAGTETGTLTLNDSQGTQAVSLSGTGTAAGVSLSLSSLTSGSTVVGTTTEAQSVTLTNTGPSDLTITSLAVSGDFALDPSTTCSASTPVAPSGTCTIAVTFAPTAAGARTGSVTITDNASGGTQTIALSGTGTPAGVTLSLSNLTSGSTVVGTTTGAQTVTLTNTGPSDLTISSLAASGDFALDPSTTCSASTPVASSGTCTIAVTFAPMVAGVRTGLVVITDSASGSPQTISLTGTGTAPVASVSPSSLTFSGQLVGTTSAAQAVTLSNAGSAALTVSSIAITGTNSGDFSQSKACGGSVAAGANCTISVTFTPTATGDRSASLTITDDAVGSPQTVALTGTGTAAPAVTLSTASLGFANQSVGTSSAAQNVTLTNSGSAALTISSIALTGANSGDFTQSNTCGGSVAAGANCTISVTFTPTAIGSRSGTLTITDDATGSPQTVALSGTGTGAVASLSATTLTLASELVGATSASQSTTLTNTGNVSLSITGISIAGANAGDFAESQNCGSSLAAGAHCAINVSFKPTAGGNRAATLSLSDNASGSPQTVALAGEGEDFTLTIPSGSSNSATVTAGQSATYSLSVTPEGGINGSVSLVCTGAPSEAGCWASPSYVTLNGSSASTVTVTVTTAAPTMAPGHRRIVPPPVGGPQPQSLLLWLLLLASLAGLAAGRKRRRRWALLAAPLLCALMWAACGGGAAPASHTPGTPAGTYPLTVTGTVTSGSTTVTQTMSLTLKVS